MPPKQLPRRESRRIAGKPPVDQGSLSENKRHRLDKTATKDASPERKGSDALSTLLILSTNGTAEWEKLSASAKSRIQI